MIKKVMIVDDSRTIRQQVSFVLSSKGGYVVVEAADGLQGLEKLKEHPDIAMIICDINMPKMDGVDMVKELIRLGNTTPVIMLTTEREMTMIEKAKEAGAKGWFVKPFEPDHLIAAIEKLS